MDRKTISVSDDVYRALKRAKRDDESFSDVIERLLADRNESHSLYGLVGMLDESDAAAVHDGSQEFRDQVNERMKDRS